MADRGLPGVFLLSICQSGTAAETPTEKECLVLPCRRTVIPVWHPPQQPGLSVPSDMCSGTSVVSDSVTPWTGTCQAPLSMGFSRQEYWIGLPCPALGNLSDPRIEPTSLMSPELQVGSLPLAPLGKPLTVLSFTVHLTLRLQADTADTQTHFSISLQNVNHTMKTAWKFIFIT